jgi:hypothetical protein
MISMTLSCPLVQAYVEHPLGLCGSHEPALAVRQITDLEQRLNILTFGVVSDEIHLDPERWSALAGLHDHWLFHPAKAAYHTSAQIGDEFKKVGIRTPPHIARVWWQICRGVQGRTKGSWRDLIQNNDDNARTLLEYLRSSRTTFPALSGPVHSARWLDLIQRMGDVPLREWETLRVPLSSQQKKAARLFGVEEEAVHPLFSSALHVWEGGCLRAHKDACGLTECPRR